MNIFQEYKIKSGLTYDEIGQKMNPPVQRGTTCKFIMDPGRCYASTINKLVEILGIPKKDAEEAWKEARKYYKAGRVDEESL
jgi:hypothetical protein